MVLAWMAARAAGLEPTPEDLCRDRPDLLAGVVAAISAIRGGEHLPPVAAIRSNATFTDGHGSADWPTAPYVPVPPPGYRVEKELGRGGMGVVYLAFQVGLNRPVALKMALDSGGDPGGLVRFLAEAEAVAAVRHPNVVAVYQFGNHAGRPFMAMEFCPRGSLADLQKEAGGRLAVRDAVALVAKSAAAVGAAHALNIIHRDLKPANVLIGESGEPKVTDFGLAKRGVGHDLTQTGAVMGTPAYMAPEQAGGRAKYVGPEADVWALGATLYHLLTGRRPFAGRDTFDLLRAVVESEPEPLRKLAPDVPRDLALVCEKCLRKDARDRYPTAAELAADLNRVLAGEPVSARPVPAWEKAWRWAKRSPTRAAAVVAAIGLAAAVVTVALVSAELDRTRANQALAEERRLGGVQTRATDKYRQAEEAATAAERLDRAAPKTAEVWSEVLADAKAAVDLLAAEPALADFPLLPTARALAARADLRLSDAGKWAEMRAELTRLADREADAVFAAIDQPGLDGQDRAARLEAAVTAGLGEFGIAPDAARPPTTGMGYFSADELREIIDRCVQLLILSARAKLRPPAGEEPAGAAARARAALLRLDGADRLVAPDPPTRASRLARTEAVAVLGDAVGAAVGAAASRAAAESTPARLAADHFFAALDLADGDDPVRAAAPLAEALRARPDHPGAEYLLAVCRMRVGEFQAAREGLTRLLDRRPKLPWPRLLRGYASMEMGKYPEARADFEAVLAQADPMAAYIARVDRGVLGIYLKDWPAAVVDLRAAVAARPDAPVAYINLALAERQRSEPPGGPDAVGAAFGGLAVALARDQERAGWERAADVIGQAIACRPGVPRLYHERAELRLRLGDHPGAKADFRQAAVLGLASGRAGTVADDEIQLGRLLERDGEYRAAADVYRSALTLRPGDGAVAWRLLASPLIALGRHAEAADALDHFLAGARVAPGSATELAGALRAKGLSHEQEAAAFRDRGALATRDKKFREALDAYTRGLALHRDPEVLALRGWTYLILDAPGLAAADFDEAVAFRPGWVEGLAGRASARVRVGQGREALTDADAAAASSATPREMYLTARAYAQAAPWLVGRGDAAAAGRAVRRAVELLDAALTATPAADRAKFWTTYVKADKSFDGIRAGGPMVALAAKYDKKD